MIGEKVQSRTMQQTRQRWEPWAWQLGQGGFGLLLTAGRVFGGMHPFGIAWLLGVNDSSLWSVGAGVVAGYVLCLPLSEGLGYLAAAAVTVAARALFPRQFTPAAISSAATLLAVQVLLAAAGITSLPQVLGAVCDVALACGAGFGVWRTNGWLQKGKAVNPGTLLMCMLALPGLQAIPMGPLSLAVAGLVCGSLVCAWRGRLSQCAVFCLSGAVVVTAAEPTLAFAGIGIGAGALAAAYFTPGERLASGCLMLLGIFLGAMAAPDVPTLVGFLGSALLGQALFFALPTRLINGLLPMVDTAHAPQPQVTGTMRQLESVARALTNIAQTVNQVYETLPKRGENYNWVVDYVAEELCRSCARREDCWVEGYSSTMDGFYRLKGVLEQEGRPALEQLPGQLGRCIRPVELCACASRGYGLYRSRRESRVKAGAMRAALTEQYSAMAQALSQMAEQLGQSMALDAAKTDRLAALFASIGLEPLECEAGYDGTGRLRATVTIPRTRFTPQELEELNQEAQRILHRQLSCPVLDNCQTVTVLSFQEQPLYIPEFGQACHAAQQQACGDAVEQFCDCFGNAHLLLCDGMGVGRAAAIDGTLAATLAARLLRAGFGAQSAARLVNVALALKSDEETSATMDLVTVDLYTGRANSFKAGACPTVLVRAGKAQLVEGSSLPVGILEQVVGRQEQTQLGPGDWVVLVSDGVLQDGTQWLCQQLELCKACGHTPQQAAELVADMARQRQPSQRPDDVTVAVMALERAVG